MPAQSTFSGLLVLVELGASWPRSVVEKSPHASCRVLVELEGEGPERFAARVTAAAGSLFARGVSLDLAVVACNERADAAAQGARKAIAQAVLGRRSLPRVVFAAPARARESFRSALAHLIAALARNERTRTSIESASELAASAAMARVA